MEPMGFGSQVVAETDAEKEGLMRKHWLVPAAVVISWATMVAVTVAGYWGAVTPLVLVAVIRLAIVGVIGYLVISGRRWARIALSLYLASVAAYGVIEVVTSPHLLGAVLASVYGGAALAIWPWRKGAVRQRGPVAG